MKNSSSTNYCRYWGIGRLTSYSAGCVRFYYVRLLADEPEQFYYLADSLNWCAVELYVAILCGSTSSFRTFTKRFFPNLLGSYGRSRSPKNQGFSDQHPSVRLDSLGHKGKSSTMISSWEKEGNVGYGAVADE
jgi:hypothetical protein